MSDTKNQFEVVRSTAIATDPAPIYDLIVDFHRWTAWSPWEDVDPNLQRTYSGAESGVGAVYEWSGNRKAGQGRMEIVEAEPGERIVVDLAFLKPFKSRNTTTFELAPDGDRTTVTWRMVGPKTFASKLMGIFTSMDKMIGPDFEKGLARLGDAATQS